MIWDCVMIHNELDMLEVRLREMETWDAVHVIVESPWTHQGDFRPLYFAAHQERFKPWADRIVHVIAGGLGEDMSPWAREHTQRDRAISALKESAADDDVVLIADVDEFVPAAFEYPEHPVAFRQKLAMYAVDWLYPQLHTCTVAARWGWVRQYELSAVRDGRYGFQQVDGGMHLTWLGGVKEQRQKLAVTCHDEMDDASRDRISSGACYERGEHHSGTCQMVPVDVDETWPKMIAKRECPESWFRPRT